MDEQTELAPNIYLRALLEGRGGQDWITVPAYRIAQAIVAMENGHKHEDEGSLNGNSGVLRNGQGEVVDAN